MRFRTALFAGALALLLGVVGATLGTVAVVLDRAARSDAEESLARARTVFDDQLALRLSLHRAEARVVAEEPRLKAVAATQDINPETVQGVARELRKAIGCELFVITDAAGRVLADVAQADAAGADLSGNELVARALKDGTASGVWTDGEGAYEVEGIRARVRRHCGGRPGARPPHRSPAGGAGPSRDRSRRAHRARRAARWAPPSPMAIRRSRRSAPRSQACQ